MIGRVRVIRHACAIGRACTIGRTCAIGRVLTRATILDTLFSQGELQLLALIAPLGKLIVMHQLEKNLLLLSKQPSLPSGAIRANTSCSPWWFSSLYVLVVSEHWRKMPNRVSNFVLF